MSEAPNFKGSKTSSTAPSHGVVSARSFDPNGTGPIGGPIKPTKHQPSGSPNSENLKEFLDAGVVTFMFRKVDKTSRFAVGTRDLNLIPKKDHPKGLNESKSEDVVTYYDLIKKAWRSFRKGSEFNDIKVTPENVKYKALSYANQGKKALLSLNELKSITGITSPKDIEKTLMEMNNEYDRQQE